MKSPTPYHATSVVFCGRGLLLMGPSGSGKSDLALRIMDAGGSLISDDYTQLTVSNHQLFGSPPENIKGMMEVRGVGLLRVPYIRSTRLDVVITCDSIESIERMPQAIHTEIEGIQLRQLSLYPFESSAVAKLRAFLQNPLITT